MKHASTAIASALSRAGINANENAFRVSLSRYLNLGGTTQRVREICDEIDEQPVEADSGVPKGQKTHASDRLTERDDEANVGMPKGQWVHASSSQPNEGGEATLTMPKDHREIASPPSAVSDAARALRRRQIDLAGHTATAKAVLYRIDGTDIRDLSLGRCRTLARSTMTESYVLRVIIGELQHLPDTTRIGDVKGDDDLRGLVRQGEAYADA